MFLLHPSPERLNLSLEGMPSCRSLKDLSIGDRMVQNGPFLLELWPIEHSAILHHEFHTSSQRYGPHIATGRHIVAMIFLKRHNS